MKKVIILLAAILTITVTYSQVPYRIIRSMYEDVIEKTDSDKIEELIKRRDSGENPVTLWKELKTFRLNKDAYTKILVLSKMKHVRYIGTCTLSDSDQQAFINECQFFKKNYDSLNKPNYMYRNDIFKKYPELKKDPVSNKINDSFALKGYNMFVADTAYSLNILVNHVYLPKEQSFFWDKKTGAFYAIYFFDYEKIRENCFFNFIPLISFRRLSQSEINGLKKERKISTRFQKFKSKHVSNRIYSKRIGILYQNGNKKTKTRFSNSPFVDYMPFFDQYKFFVKLSN